MKDFLIFLLSAVSLTLSGATYYISPGGSDSNPGTIAQPFYTLYKAWTIVTAGDTIYLRGGTYSYTTPQRLTDKDGRSGSYINIWNYPGEAPVISYAGQKFLGQVVGILFQHSDYIYLKGIRITEIAQPVSGSVAMVGLMLKEDVNNSIFERIETDHIGGWGTIVKDACTNILFLNCDSHHNSDPFSVDTYGGSDGFLSGSPTSTNITFRGCRAWWNSDDGWDLRNSNGVYIFENCWAFWNGYIPDTFDEAGNGLGFKLGGKTAPATTEILRSLYNSISFQNRTAGFDAQPDGSDLYFSTLFYNCLAYANGHYGFVCDWYTEADILKNCISYFNGTKDFLHNSYTVSSNNSWNSGITLTNADFISVDTKGVDGVRETDGSIPKLDFLRLAAGSDLIDAGVDVGLPFNGTAPDLGYSEYTSGPVLPTSPVFENALIENSTPSRLEITYSLNLANIVPPSSAFTVLVNSSAKSISSVAVSGTKVLLTLASPVVYGDIVTLTYTKPPTNPLQTSVGGQAASVTNIPVVNNCAAPAANNSPAVIISSPTKGNTYMAPATITIDIEASDQDGIISKVELFNGATKIGERTATPFSFTLKDLPEGSYSLKAVATDNLKATTASSVLDLQITSYNENREYFILYPNPNDGRFSIDFASPLVAENYTVTIFNLIGTTVYREELPKDNNVKQFDLSHLKPGTYVLMISSNQILLTQKFIKG